ncbi:MAG: glycoside hydrolase family 31 protein [Oliverpabstia sp.]|nr:alpha-glucosidase [Lachnospiraceae bacterium]MCI7740644.1 alpha-glucosidase [Lachnospiraceae bacterium]MDY5025428.1 glycoside hydrolase family 31 protein [Oliverpabstia sp.]
MIRRYVYGNVLETEAVLEKPEKEQGQLPYFTVNEQEKTFLYQMDASDRVYGLGENVRGINKRGWIYESKCSDDPEHKEDRHSLYGAHNFLVVDGKEQFGIFIDYPGILTFDVGYTKHNELKIKASDWNLDVYLITGTDVKDIVKQFRHMVGRSYVAPLWAFGYGQSRWSYMNEDEVREVVKKHRDLGIPLDSVYLDIDYMERYKDFTLNDETFPDFAKFNEEMKEQNIHLVPIIDAGVKQEDGYDVYEEGLEKGYFCTKEDGSPFVAAVWPGKALFPDMLNKEARDWFGDQYKFLLDQGVEGFWNDMNEPAIFYTEDRLKDVLEKLDTYKGQNLDLDRFWEFTGLVSGLSNNVDDYKMFYHNMNGERVSHDRVHNLFGYNMTRAAGEAFERLEPDKRILMFSRSSYVGMHRYGGIWQGDNKSWWSHILLNLKMMPSLNMCGFLYTGADIGGFGADTTEDLLLRWLELGIFTPLMRNHSALGTRVQEAYRFEDIEGFRHVIGLRYRFLPYIYSEYMKAVLRDEMMFRPLAFDYPQDAHAVKVEDQLLLGDGLMIAPIYEQNAEGRYVYLPEKMKMVRFKKGGITEEKILEAGHHYVEVGLTDVVVFVRPNHLIPMSTGGQCVADVDFENLQYLSYVEEGEAVYEYYHDNGYEKDYENPEHITVIRMDREGNVRK